MHPGIQGEFRLRLVDAAGQEAVRAKHPDWFLPERGLWLPPRHEAREDVLASCTHSDTGWVKNTATTMLREFLAAAVLNVNAADLFIHASTMTGNEERNAVQFVYASQSPGQVRNPDTQVFSEVSQTQTRTVQFPPPSVTRTIASVGLTGRTSIEISAKTLAALLAYQKLSTPTVQTTGLAADLLYRLSFTLI